MTTSGKPASPEHKSGVPPTEVDVAIVGGGVAGLFCCLQLFNRYSSVGAGEPLKTIALFEGSSRLGGRIESWRIDPKRYDAIRSKAVKSAPGMTSVLHQMEIQDEAQRDAEAAQTAPVPLDDFMVAEFGPMRVEPAHQPFLRRLLEDLHIAPESGPYRKWSDQVPFSPYASEAPADPAFRLDGEESQQTTILDLMLLALRRIFESVEIVDGDNVVTENPWRLGSPDDPDDAKDKDTPYHELNHFWREMRDDRFLHRRYWQRYMRDWINLLREEQYQVIRTRARFVGTPLHQMGFWNVLGSVLSHMATVKLRDWGSFYHLVGDNPNAAEWIIFWLRAMRSTDSLVGIRGGMDWIVYKACAQLGFRRDESDAPDASGEDRSPRYRSGVGRTAPNQVQAQLCMEMSLRSVRESEGGPIALTFDWHGQRHIVNAKQVILALPQAPLQNIVFESSRDAGAQTSWNEAFATMLDAVMPIPLLKCFMVVDNPFWEDNRPANQYAYTVPSREVHYWKSGDKRTGLLMLYSDRPSNQFWADYLTDAFREDLLPALGPQLIEPHLKPGTSHELKVTRRRQDEAITWSWKSDESLQASYDRSGSGWTISKFGNDRLLRTFLSYVRENHAESVSDDRVLAAGLRDWGLKPFVGACHAWRSGTDPTLVINYLKAFSMLPSVAKANCRLHVCGEAYSDYQGFIEGALRSAAEVLAAPPFGISKDDLRVRDRRLGRTRRVG
jgi:monoamine oxidase